MTARAIIRPTHAQPVPKRTHAELKNAVMRACNLIPGVFVFPAGVGSFVSVYKGRKRFIQLGMKGCSDLVGWQTRHLGMLSKMQGFESISVPRFLALEIKTGRDALRPEQKAFLDLVRAAGGIALEVRSVEQAVEALR